MARVYKRDSRGRFAGGGGSSGGRPAAKAAPRGTNRLTRDNSGRITGTGNGATARGGRLRTAGGALRATQTARISGGGGKLRGGKAGARAGVAVKVAAKGYSRGVNPAKVERMLGRLQEGASYQGRTSRLLSAKQSAGVKTRQKAADFLSKQAGLQSDGTSMGRKRWKVPDGMTRGQMMQNIASRLPSQSRRSTARPGSKKIATRAERREQRIQDKLNPPRASYTFGREPTKRSGSTRLSQRYDGGTARSSRAMAGAAARQRARRQITTTLAGTGRLMRPAARISRGRAAQTTLMGGRRTTYGRPRRR